MGKKLGMTRIFNKDNEHVPISLIHIVPNKILSIKNVKDNGYNAIQVGFGQRKHLSKSVAGHLKKSNTKSIERIIEFKVKEDELVNFKLGQTIGIESFEIGKKITISGISKGKGFAGVMKRHNFSGMPASHGHEKQRIPGSIGCRFPQRTIKGKRMAGHMGNEKITIKNLKIVDLDKENQILSIKGSIPGIKKNIIQIIAN